MSTFDQSTRARPLSLNLTFPSFLTTSFLATFAAAALTLVVTLTFVVMALNVPDDIFRSPDENASYLFTKTLADTGHLYYTADYLQGDTENLLHPRGAITHDGKAVPFNFLGLPVLYAPFYKLLGEDIRFIAIPLTIMTVVSLASAGSLLTKDRPWIAWLAVLGLTPFIATFTRPLLNVLPSIAFLSAGLYFQLRYFQAGRGGRLNLILGSGAFALAAWMRYELIIFQSLAMLIVIIHKRRNQKASIVKDLAIYSIVNLLIFVIPVLLLNDALYGSPLTYGYKLFNEAFFPDRVALGQSSALELISRLRAVLLPAYPLDLGLAGHALIYQVYGAAPLLIIAAGLGLWSVCNNRRPPLLLLAAYGLLAAYIYLYRGAGFSWAADEETPTLEASIVRYSLPLYLGVYLLAVHGLAKSKGNGLVLACLTMIAVASFTGLLRDLDGNPLFIRDRLNDSKPSIERLVASTEPDSIIYTDIYDKALSTKRNIATWWGGSLSYSEGHFKPDEIAKSMRRVFPQHSVYLIVSEEDIVLPPLRDELAREGLGLSPVNGTRLYHLEPLTGQAPLPTRP